tara:strand:+ start:1277 stop:2986 length:1710 start_codon:yes stop_codon:yes gene_type:complete
MFAYVTSDFSNYNVFQNSHSTLPIIYKISGTWGNHEGSMLLWLLILSFYNLFFLIQKNVDANLRKLTIILQNFIYVCFALFVIFTSNPFLVNSIFVSEGLGLNPILQDPALAIHPPILYMGYIGFSLILSFALSGLILKKIDTEWINTAKKCTLFCWSMLGAGIGLGSYWAYYELGWGGWWFWDPVENISLMPWICGLALVHSLMIARPDYLLKRWIVFLSIMCFTLSIFGTFLVRSGILTSVHAFANDTSRGIFILILFLVLTGFSFIIFIIKSEDSNAKLNLLFINKTTALMFNNIIMLTALLTILLGTIYPIIIEVLTNKRMSVGAPYFNSTALPIMLPGFLLMSIAPALSWQNNKLHRFKNYIYVFLLMSIITVIISYFTDINLWGFLGIVLSLIIISSSALSMYFNYKKFKLKKFFHNNNSLIAHIGVGIMIMGITCSSVFQSTYNLTFSLQEKKIVGKYTFEFDNLDTLKKGNFEELLATFVITENKFNTFKIKPSKRYYNVSKYITTEAAIYHDWLQDLYVVLGDINNEKLNIKIYTNPLVSLIWLGIIIMFISGIVGVRKK